MERAGADIMSYFGVDEDTKQIVQYFERPNWASKKGLGAIRFCTKDGSKSAAPDRFVGGALPDDITDLQTVTEGKFVIVFNSEVCKTLVELLREKYDVKVEQQSLPDDGVKVDCEMFDDPKAP